jgi:hypothetical protein
MKKLNAFLVFVGLPLLLSSCISRQYQVFEVNSSNVEMKGEEWTYKDEKISINYDLWFDGGLMNFQFSNICDSPIFINWDLSHFIYNGYSFDYYSDLEETNVQANSSTISVSSLSNSKITYNSDGYIKKNSTDKIYSRSMSNFNFKSSTVKSKKIVQLPPHSSIVVSHFILNKKPYFNCDFNLKSKDSAKSKRISFNDENSPLNFRNYLTYSTDPMFVHKSIIDNSFYVSSILILDDFKFYGKSIKNKKCDSYGYEFVEYKSELPYKKPNTYFIQFK